MKKIFRTLAVTCGLSLTLSLAGCGGNDPKTVVDDAFTAMKEGDAEALMDCAYLDDLLADARSWRDFKGDLPEELRHQLQITLSVMPMVQEMLKDVSWTLGEVRQDGDEAVVIVKTKRGDEGELESHVKVVKDKSGKWKIKSMGDLM